MGVILSTHMQLDVFYSSVNIRVDVTRVLNVVSTQSRTNSQLFIRHGIQRDVHIVRLLHADDLRRYSQILTEKKNDQSFR